MSLFVEPDAGYGPVLDFIGNATSTLDYWIYKLADPTLQAALAAAAARGVKVRVILSWQTFPAKSDLWDPNPPRCTISAATGLCPVQCGGSCGNANYNPNAAIADELRATGVAAQMSPFWWVGWVVGQREKKCGCVWTPCHQPPARTHTLNPPTHTHTH